MILFKTIDQLQQYLAKQKNKGLSIGFVPTMGALHQGHISLISIGKEKVNITVCSIFVNPTQFNDSKDFEKYPITIDNDILLLEKAGCDVLFLPSADEIYPNETTIKITHNLGYLETILEGKFRPNHFQGVCQVVHRLLSIVQPNTIILGQKDYQQCMVIKKLIDETGLKVNIQIGKTLREKSGLAMSSRNMRLTETDRENAIAIYQSLVFMKANIDNETIVNLKFIALDTLTINQFDSIDYIEICDANSLQPLLVNERSLKKIVVVAAFLNGVRLIDNILLD